MLCALLRPCAALMLAWGTTTAGLAAPQPDVDDGAMPAATLTPLATVTLKGVVFHVQGVDLDADFIYVTSVDKDAHRGYVHKFTRDGALVKTVELTEGARYHTGGISLAGKALWVPLAEYRRGSTTRILRLDKATLTPTGSFVVDDHIGAITFNDGRLYGANWGARRFYVWDANGLPLAQPRNATRIDYQDFKFAGGALVASGTVHDQTSGAIDWLDPQTLQPRQRLTVGKNADGLAWTREGMAIADGRLYLLPADGHDGRAELYVFDLAALRSTAVADCMTAFGNSCTTLRGPTMVAVRQSAARRFAQRRAALHTAEAP